VKRTPDPIEHYSGKQKAYLWNINFPTGDTNIFKCGLFITNPFVYHHLIKDKKKAAIEPEV